MKSLYLIKKAIFCKKEFFPPKKNKLVLFDVNFLEPFKLFEKKKKFTILHTRLEVINFYIILVLIFKRKKMSFFNYVLEYLKYTNCKTFLTFNDNNISVYKIKKYLPKLKVFVVQNGHRNSLFFEDLENHKDLKADFIFTFNRTTGKVVEK